jgi:hypothetical protein
MATSTLIQFLDAGEGADTSNRRQVETFLAGGAIAAGDVVALDIVGQTGTDSVLYVIQAGLVATGNPSAVGVSLDTVAAGQQVRVVVSGYAADVNCTAGTIAANAALSAGKTAAGEVETAANTDTAGLFAVSLEAKGATTANRVAIHILKRF